jgi:hypothetical protein
MQFQELVPIIGHAVLHYTKPDGTIGWVRTVRNGVTIEGCNWILETVFRGGTQSPLIYAGLVNSAAYSAVNSLDTHALHAGWTEFSGLLSATRPIWTPAAAVGGLMGTTAAASFSIAADGFIRGVFLSNISAVGSTAPGILYNTAINVTPLAVANGGILAVTFAARIGV